jgi:hypothetical protein
VPNNTALGACGCSAQPWRTSSTPRISDLAVEGLQPEKFFDFYGRLFFELPKPVDLVDLSQNPPIAAIIRSQGVSIYERSA